MSVQQEKFKEIADAIREKTNSTEKIRPSEFAGKVGEVYEAGKKAEYEAFWADYLSNVGRASFAGNAWNDETFKPPRGSVIQPKDAYYMFIATGITDLAKICDEREITLDFSKATSGTGLFLGSGNPHLTHIGRVDVNGIYAVAQIFRDQTYLHTIDCFALRPSSQQTFSQIFTGCTALENLTIEGTISNNGFDVSACTKLTHDSLMSIINALKSGASYTVTFGSTNLAKLTDAEKAIATTKGWTLL